MKKVQCQDIRSTVCASGETALVDSALAGLIVDGCFKFPTNDLTRYVQPASIDIPISGNVFLVKEKTLPFRKKVKDIVQELKIDELSLAGDGALLLKGCTYLVNCGKVQLPEGCRGSMSPKSSIGRIDIMARGMLDECGLYDTIPAGCGGSLWLEISPQSFNIRVKEGLALTQMMVFKRTAPSTADSPPPPPLTDALLYDADGVELTPQLHRGAVVLGLDLPNHESADGEADVLLGFEAQPTNEVLDLSKIGVHAPESFFRPIMGKPSGKLTLVKDRFYILSTKERVCVPPTMSAEMMPFSHHVGELRAHYAGFFDPGFGFGANGELKGTIGVLEVRPHETFTVYDGQPICLMEFYRNDGVPNKPYGFAGNTYQHQRGPQLAKYFKPKSLPVGVKRKYDDRAVPQPEAVPQC